MCWLTCTVSFRQRRLPRRGIYSLKAMLRALRKAIPVERVVLLVREFEMQGDRVRVTVHPRSPDGMEQYEPVTAVMQKEGTVWGVGSIDTARDEE